MVSCSYAPAERKIHCISLQVIFANRQNNGVILLSILDDHLDMTSSKPTIVFVPGAWHSPEGYQDVISNLEPHGYKCVGIDLPTVGANPPKQDFNPDRDAISKAITDAAENGEDVVVVMHSYGGFPGTEAVKGLTRKDREGKGQNGGVVRLVYLTAFMVPEGVTLIQTIGGKPLPWFDVQVSQPISSMIYER